MPKFNPVLSLVAVPLVGELFGGEAHRFPALVRPHQPSRALRLPLNFIQSSFLRHLQTFWRPETPVELADPRVICDL
jgi:hypothetical protein